MNAGDIDCIWNAFVKNEREDVYRWTDSYMQSNLRAIVDAKAPDHDLQTLKGHGGMAVRTGSKLEGVLMDNADLPSRSARKTAPTAVRSFPPRSTT